MGRLPDSWAGRKITFRIPYEMPGEITLVSNQAGSQFPDGTFVQNVDKPFEIHRAKPIVTVLDANNAPLVKVSEIPTQEVLQQLVRVRLTDFGQSEVMTKSPSLVALLTKGSAEATWEFAEPYTLERGTGFQIVVDALDLTNLLAAVTGAAKIKLSWMFQGFLIVVAPPSESR